jgi:hypothetical protein
VKEAIMRKFLLAALAPCVLGGCSTMNSTYSPYDDMDLGYIAYVENASRQIGTTLLWVNPPRKPQSATK